MTADKQRPVPDDELAQQARAVFDDSVESLDAATRSRLNRSRQAALEKAASQPPYLRPLPWLATSGAAAAVVAAILLTGPADAPPSMPPMDAAADVEILLDGDDFEMLEELEFYSWIELGPETASHVG